MVRAGYLGRKAGGAASTTTRSGAAMAKGAAFVTGGASGLGRAIAGRLASDGHPVVIADIDLEGADKARSEIEGAGGGL